ncbi:hypothetical protein V8G54_034498 [Vigna mungo]|uniref:Uncharacterized protein n=1 Tax=Vigna mungo TaxID=3915 RepID=A0AAQ3RKV6_VIGMU
MNKKWVLICELHVSKVNVSNSYPLTYAKQFCTIHFFSFLQRKCLFRTKVTSLNKIFNLTTKSSIKFISTAKNVHSFWNQEGSCLISIFGSLSLHFSKSQINYIHVLNESDTENWIPFGFF